MITCDNREMIGTLINVPAIIIGGLLGFFFGALLSDNLK